MVIAINKQNLQPDFKRIFKPHSLLSTPVPMYRPTQKKTREMKKTEGNKSSLIMVQNTQPHFARPDNLRKTYYKVKVLHLFQDMCN
jgi:hypothetical protein